MSGSTEMSQLRLNSSVWSELHTAVFDALKGERCGVLLVHPALQDDDSVLIATHFMPVPDEYMLAGPHGFDYDGRFNFRVVEAIAETNSSAILVHAHANGFTLGFSRTDLTFGSAFLNFMDRRLPNRRHGMIVINNTSIEGFIRNGTSEIPIERLSVSRVSYTTLLREATYSASSDDRQLISIGNRGQTVLENMNIAVVGYSGGGSHVVQQLIHAGAGRITVIDPDILEDTNLRRFVGATKADIGKSKLTVAHRLAETVRPETQIIPVKEYVPSAASISALLACDVIVGCLDNWSTRDVLNRIAGEFHVPYIDIGAIVVSGSDRSTVRIGGQVTLVASDGACLRCMGLITDERIADGIKHQQYEDATIDPQVVSINGTLASEAVSLILLLCAGSDGLSRYRTYRFPPGKLSVVNTSKRENCQDCGRY